MMVLVILLLVSLSLSSLSLISIRGGNSLQSLPLNMAKSFTTYTFDDITYNVDRVEGTAISSDTEGWVNPTSFTELYCPKDLPLPKATPSIGVCVVQGIPRYIMPSIILSLETPERIWRNRGLCSLPRAHAWIDLFSPYINLDSLVLSSFSKVTGDVRFLEDQDGAGSWQDLRSMGSSALSFVRPEQEQLKIAKTFRDFKDLLKEGIPELRVLNEGYSFVDLPIKGASDWTLSSSLRIKQYLSDFDDPKRLLELENPDDLASEPIGELDIKVETVAAGRTSKYLPECYRSLYEEGNIIYS